MNNTKSTQERLLKIILAPHISEKSTYIGEKNNENVFRVATDSTKHEIKDAIEMLWKDQKIEVTKVCTINVKGKKKRFGRFVGRRTDWKKAIVTVKDGQELSLANFSNVEAIEGK